MDVGSQKLPYCVCVSVESCRSELWSVCACVTLACMVGPRSRVVYMW